jgi:hypothetical protein
MKRNRSTSITQETSNKLADKTIEPSDYNNPSQLSSGLATTHEQAIDAYTEGTADATIDNLNGEDVKIPREGYDNMFEQEEDHDDEFPYPTPS